MKMKAFLILEDGTVFEGIHIGAEKEIISEIVFNTSMAGYLEVLTDPSYAGQAVCMTYPLIGNYGVCREDCESRRPWPDGFIVRELSRMPSNFRSDCTIQEYLEIHGVPGIAGIDTRALTKILREKGTMNGMITTNADYCLEEILPRLAEYTTGKVVEKVTCEAKYEIRGVKDLADNGPGDPKECESIIAEIRKLYETDIPIFAICLGHQLMALATGADTFKMKYGHRGGNHPVKDLSTGRVYISSQNHGYVVDMDKLDSKVAVPAFINVNDGTNEGLSYTGKNIFTVQFHPEACPGPQDSGHLFDRFFTMMNGGM